MRKLFYTAAVAAAMIMSSTAANAAALVTSPSTLTPPASAFFGNTFNGAVPGTFSDTFTFTIGGSSSASTNAQLSTILLNGVQNVSFNCPTCSIFVDVNTLANRFVQTSIDPAPETWALLAPIVLTPGSHTIFVNGNLTGPSGAYSGTLNVQAVPEPATWAMMILGFGAVGMALRRRRRPVLAQLA